MNVDEQRAECAAMRKRVASVLDLRGISLQLRVRIWWALALDSIADAAMWALGLAIRACAWLRGDGDPS